MSSSLPKGCDIRTNKDGSSTFTVRYREAGRGSKQLRKSFKTEAELLRFLADRAEGVEAVDAPAASAEETVRSALALWWDEEVRATKVKRTRDNYKLYLEKQILPKLGGIAFAELSQKKVRQFRNELVAEGVPAQTVNECLKTLSAACGWLVESGETEMAANPCSGVKRLKVEKNRDPREALTPEQVARLAASMPTQRDTLIVYLLGFEGLRWVELSALRWRDLLDDQHRPRARFVVRRSKTAAGIRPPVLFEPLHEWVFDYWVARGKPSADELVFSTQRGTRLDEHNWSTRVWRPVLAALGSHPDVAMRIRYRVPYALRRSCATMLLYAGWNVRKVADHIGHADRGVTLLTDYADVIADADEMPAHTPPEQQIAAAIASASAVERIKFKITRKGDVIYDSAVKPLASEEFAAAA